CISFFFFSSRRRHTRFSRDWSSDVCSSDLRQPASTPSQAAAAINGRCTSTGPIWPCVKSARTALRQPRVEKALLAKALFAPAKRSEERRVGKECRCRWAAEQ